MPQVRSRPGRRGARGRTGFLGVLMGSVAMVAVIGVLSGCAAGDPEITPLPTSSVAEQSSSSTPTPTPEPTSGAYFAPEPQSEEEAIEQATEAYEFFLATAAEVYANPSDTSPIDEIAKQSAANGVKTSAQVYLENDAEIHYDERFEVDSDRSMAVEWKLEDGTTLSFGSVQLYGCLNTSGSSGLNSDGTEVGFPEQRRAQVAALAGYDPSEGRWYIYEGKPEQGPDGGIIPC